MENTSKVSDLIERLKDLDEDKNIRIVAICGYDNVESDVSDLELSFDETKDSYTIYL